MHRHLPHTHPNNTTNNNGNNNGNNTTNTTTNNNNGTTHTHTFVQLGALCGRAIASGTHVFVAGAARNAEIR